MSFVVGQRWHSRTEPELGLGLVELVDGREVLVSFPAREVVRRYSMEEAPLARARLSEGQLARSADGKDFVVQQVIEEDGLLRYVGDGQELAEAQLDAVLDVATPENRLSTGQVDPVEQFGLRHRALEMRHKMLASPARGFLGGRIKLFAHQLSIARDVCERHRVRVLLADEVGLGKTIEALLILHRMLLTGRVERVLALVPPALVHQWLAEAYLKFNLVLRVIGSDTHGGGSIDLGSQDLPFSLLGAQLFVCPYGVDAERLTHAEWDLLVVDEAHRLEPGSADFALTEELAAHVDHVMLLSATPDRDGEAAHFRRLAWLDPARFHDYDAYQREAAHYRALADTAERLHTGAPLQAEDRALLAERLASGGEGAATADLLAAADADPAARATLLARLLDLHGIGRVMFRNVRARIAGFPERRPCAAALSSGDPDRLRREFLHDEGRSEAGFRITVQRDPRLAWLRDFLAERPDEKVLVLCSDRDKVEAFGKGLESRKREVARFHEQMSAIERDRQAAWFLADDGPQLLISSAIAAEGRNFQVARNLVLLDLPASADRLEQRIGRVDRIGQGAEVRIFVPTLPGTPQDRLRRWYDEALAVFERPWHGSPAFEREFAEPLTAALLAPDDAAIDALIKHGAERNRQIIAELEQGRDRLLELTSFDAAAAAQLGAVLAAAEADHELEDFMVAAFERAGLDLEDLGRRSYAVRVGPDYHRPFPGFSGEEMAVTFDRDTGLTHPERILLTWDHPMVRDTIDTLLAHETGNASVAHWATDAPGLWLEAWFVAEPALPQALRADRFLPPTPLRVVVDAKGDEVAAADAPLPVALRPADAALLEHPQLRDALPDLVARARECAEARAPALAAAAVQHMRRELEPAVDRLARLSAVNASVSTGEIEAARVELAALEKGLLRLRVRLDALRLIVGG
ncbi:MAG: RNA polymerase-associated protein RapA [Planctomycetota bacterium]